jgi:hypothetical protein
MVRLSTTVTTNINLLSSWATATQTGSIVSLTIPTPTITTKDEGTTTSTAVTTLDFVGFGVEVSGAGATATVTVNGPIIVQCVITTNVASLTGIPSTTVADGVTLSSGDLVLLTSQTTASQNGVYDVAAGAWSRAKLLTGNNASGCQVLVTKGRWWATVPYQCTSLIGSDVVGTNNLTWKSIGLLPDYGLDSGDDIFAYAYDEAPATVLSTLDSKVGAAQTISFTANGVIGAAFADFATAGGPFGGISIDGVNALYGYQSANNGAVLPTAFTVQAWIRPVLLPVTFTSNQLMFFARTNTNAVPASAGWPAEYEVSVSTDGPTIPGSATEFYRLLRWSAREGGGVFNQNATTIANQAYLLPIVDKWHHVVVTYDGTNLILYVDGRRVSAAQATVRANAAGRWTMGGCAIGAAAGVYGSQFSWKRWRLSQSAWSQATINEVYNRGAAWGI